MTTLKQFDERRRLLQDRRRLFRDTTAVDDQDMTFRSQQQEMQLSRSLGACPSFLQSRLHRQRTCGDQVSTTIYYAGYLLKRSNHPVGITPSAAQHESSNIPQHQPQQQQQRISSSSYHHDESSTTSTTAYSNGGNGRDWNTTTTGINMEEEDSHNQPHHDHHDHDVFAADWETGEEDVVVGLFPSLPFTTFIDSNGGLTAAVVAGVSGHNNKPFLNPSSATNLGGGDYADEKDDFQNGCDGIHARTPSAAARTAAGVANNLAFRPRNDFFSSKDNFTIHSDFVVEGKASSEETLFLSGSRRPLDCHPNAPQHLHQHERHWSEEENDDDDSNHGAPKDHHGERVERFWKQMADLFGVPTPTITKATTRRAAAAATVTPTRTIGDNAQSVATGQPCAPQTRRGIENAGLRQTTNRPHDDPAVESIADPYRTAIVRSNPIKMPTRAEETLRATYAATVATSARDQRQPFKPSSGQLEHHHHHQQQQHDISNRKILFSGDQPRAESCSSMETKRQQQEQPLDFHDEKGHIWRSKYCVLQDNVLYFYRNQSDAESPPAKAERIASCNQNNYSNSNNSSPNGGGGNDMATSSFARDSLARSPIPRKYIISHSNQDDNNNHHHQGHLWEKRVEVQCIGAVRSAETEYGPHSFALLSPPSDNELNDDEEDRGVCSSIESAEDKLILRSRNTEEMEEWLFQFHKSIDVYVRNLITIAGSFGGCEQDCNNISLLSPLCSNNNPRRITTLLSHGHGRAHAPRRRQNDGTGGGRRSSDGGGGGGGDSPPFSTRLQPRSTTTSNNNNNNNNTKLPTVPPPHRIRQLSSDCVCWVDRPASLNTFRSSPSTTTTTTTTTVSSPLMITPPQYLHPPFQSLQRPSSTSSVTIEAGSPSPRNNSTCANSNGNNSVSSHVQFIERTSTSGGGGDDAMSPEYSAPQSFYPETERPIPVVAMKKQTVAAAGGGGCDKYIPPFKRQQQCQQQQQLQQQSLDAAASVQTTTPTTSSKSKLYIPPHLRKNGDVPSVVKPASLPPPKDNSSLRNNNSNQDMGQQFLPTSPPPLLNLGGCADPRAVSGSIMDPQFVPLKASILKSEVRLDPFGYRHRASANLTWDIGAVSECGVRDSNEDSYLVAWNLLEVLHNGKESTLNQYAQHHPPGLFCVFDGHLGDQAARYSAERLTTYLADEACCHNLPGYHDDLDATTFVEGMMRRALEKLDNDFCNFCVEGNREWESGATALLAVLVDNELIVGNLGDARAVASRSVDKETEAKSLEEQGWSRLPDSDSGSSSRSCMWIEMSETHSPSREDEKHRIDQANGWITVERSIPLAQLHRLNWQDADVFDILQRCFADRYECVQKASAPQRVVEISRVCGELAVSRALGDRDFKAAFNTASSTSTPNSDDGQSTNVRIWDSNLFLCFPNDQRRSFQGDLISNIPEFRRLKVGDNNNSVYEEFFLLACDGLWDVMDLDDAVRVTRDLLFDKKWSAREAAARLAELAIHLGSSDNITVIILAFDNHHHQQQENS